jgi:hypothetical protein
MDVDCLCARPRTIGANNINAVFPPHRRSTTVAPSSEKTAVASVSPRSGIATRPNQIRDFREQNSDHVTYRCLKSWQQWFTQSDCHYAIKNPEHDRCWYQTLQGECNRED